LGLNRLDNTTSRQLRQILTTATKQYEKAYATVRKTQVSSKFVAREQKTLIELPQVLPLERLQYWKSSQLSKGMNFLTLI
jgi:hypothetical protein